MGIGKGRGRIALVMTTATMLVIGAAGFEYAQQSHAAGAQAQAQPVAPQVEVSTLQPESVNIWSEFSGRLAAVEVVQVRPRVSGSLDQVLFREGAQVKAGDPLYVIDPRPYAAAVASAKAALTSARSRVEFARVELDRVKGLEYRKVISKSQFDSVNNDYRVAQADLNAAQAALDLAQLDLEYAHIKAPTSGRISRSEVTRGNLVEGGANGPVLTTIVSSDRLYAEFDVDEQTYLNLVRNHSARPLAVTLSLSGGDDAVYTGELHAFDNHLSTQTGTIRARALFDNPDGALIPGMFASVRIAAPVQGQALLIEQRALGTNQDQKYVYVVDENNVVTYRPVTLGAAVGERRLVLQGLNAGDKVMVNSLMRVMPGMSVTPVDKAVAAKSDPSVAYQL
ncbi:efflux RND transporter periplasmic adaptor subunit [Marinobacterium sedimentorum]|uniref:efflux RND transporter periplasmic adaptor subunit n=1 Tax=Marinobacterium sedimentorum TaxID=2927804 RepID=UPI0020C61EEE|nr:efflux RND transporter periplasmic adaptor subunit [Marinobacterium sedimentorum]MCP8689163.1 efflux RND transporter periplasmic adaptor subunit [Marinobacterium sedimentorum]